MSGIPPISPQPPDGIPPRPGDGGAAFGDVLRRNAVDQAAGTILSSLAAAQRRDVPSYQAALLEKGLQSTGGCLLRLTHGADLPTGQIETLALLFTALRTARHDMPVIQQYARMMRQELEDVRRDVQAEAGSLAATQQAIDDSIDMALIASPGVAYAPPFLPNPLVAQMLPLLRAIQAPERGVAQLGDEVATALAATLGSLHSVAAQQAGATADLRVSYALASMIREAGRAVRGDMPLLDVGTSLYRGLLHVTSTSDTVRGGQMTTRSNVIALATDIRLLDDVVRDRLGTFRRGADA